MHRIRAFLWIPVLLVGLSACGIFDPGVCTTEARPAIIVEVRDALSGAPAAAGAQGYVEEGAFRAELVGPLPAQPGEEGLRFFGPEERAGTYRVTVEKPGYQQWRREDVRVSRDECHVRTVHLRADLQPDS